MNFFFGSNTIQLNKQLLLQKIRDYFFASAAFPTGMFVCASFWSLYHTDRNLIYPENLDRIISPTLNHVMHTLPGVAICLESLVHYHRYPSRLIGLSTIVIISVVYTAWIHYLNYIHWIEFKIDLWVYPVLKELSFIYRGLFLLGSTMFIIGLYFIGEMYTLFLINLRINKTIEKKTKKN